MHIDIKRYVLGVGLKLKSHSLTQPMFGEKNRNNNSVQKQCLLIFAPT